jgi:NAD(P)-dependent dehydrogenase (short-subunit alcohol dehydrogenase family)
MDASAWRRVLSVNLDGPFFWSQAVAIASMLPRRSGAIVNVSSLAGLVSGPNIAAYTASKHGLVGLTKALAIEWAPRGIRVNAICPGFTETNLVAAARIANPVMFAERVARIPTGVAATAEDQADAILFLASDQARAIAGLVMNIDGGTLAMSSGFSVVRP